MLRRRALVHPLAASLRAWLVKRCASNLPREQKPAAVEDAGAKVMQFDGGLPLSAVPALMRQPRAAPSVVPPTNSSRQPCKCNLTTQDLCDLMRAIKKDELDYSDYFFNVAHKKGDWQICKLRYNLSDEDNFNRCMYCGLTIGEHEVGHKQDAVKFQGLLCNCVKECCQKPWQDDNPLPRGWFGDRGWEIGQMSYVCPDYPLQLEWEGHRRLTVVTGESGCGKTVAVLSSLKPDKQVGIYVSLSQHQEALKEAQLDTKPDDQVLMSGDGSDDKAQHEVDTEDRNRRFEAFLRDSIKEALANGMNFLSNEDKSAFFRWWNEAWWGKISTIAGRRIVVVFDDCGPFPAFLRAAAAYMSSSLFFYACIACGIGKLGFTAADFPPQTRVLTVSAFYTWDIVSRQFSPECQMSVWEAALRKNHELWELMHNPRAAAGVFEHFRTLMRTGATWKMDEEARALWLSAHAHAFVSLAVLHCRARNGLKDLECAECRRLAFAAAHALFFSVSLADRDIVVAIQRGILNDSRWIADSDEATRRGIFSSACMKKSCCRFTVSPAQIIMMRSCFGMEPQSSTGEGFEVQTAYFLRFVFEMALERNVSLKDLLLRLGADESFLNKLTITWPPEMMSVRIIQLTNKIEPSDTPPVAAPSWLQADQVTICLNGAKASFADILVFIPKCAVLFVQCKRLESEMRQTEILLELAKMGWRSDDGWAALLADQHDKESLLQKCKELHYPHDGTKAEMAKRLLAHERLPACATAARKLRMLLAPDGIVALPVFVVRHSQDRPCIRGVEYAESLVWLDASKMGLWFPTDLLAGIAKRRWS